MPNIAHVFRAEITRLAKKEIKAEVAALRKASVHYRSVIAELKRTVADQAKRISRLERSQSTPASTSVSINGHTLQRFSAQKLRKTRQNLGLSAPEAAKFLGVSTATQYNYEWGKHRPGEEQMARIAALRKLSPKQAQEILQRL